MSSEIEIAKASGLDENDPIKCEETSPKKDSEENKSFPISSDATNKSEKISDSVGLNSNMCNERLNSNKRCASEETNPNSGCENTMETGVLENDSKKLPDRSRKHSKDVDNSEASEPQTAKRKSCISESSDSTKVNHDHNDNSCPNEINGVSGVDHQTVRSTKMSKNEMPSGELAPVDVKTEPGSENCVDSKLTIIGLNETNTLGSNSEASALEEKDTTEKKDGQSSANNSFKAVTPKDPSLKPGMFLY